MTKSTDLDLQGGTRTQGARLTPVYAEARPSLSHPEVVRLLVLAPPSVVRVYIAGRTVPPTPEGRSSFLQSISKKWVPDGQWAESWPDVPGVIPTRVREKPWEGHLKEWDEVGFDVERHFAEMEESVVLVSEERARRRIFKKKAKNNRDGHETILHLVRRDGPECCWCGVVTDPELPEKHPLRATVEHVIPTSRGGATSYRNFRVACRKCNTVRGNKGGHPNFPLRDRSPIQYTDPPRVLSTFRLSTAEDWEPTVDGHVGVSTAVSGKQHRSCTVYAKGGRVEMVYRVENTGVDAEAHVLSVAESIPVPVTFDGLLTMGFRWVPYCEPRGFRSGHPPRKTGHAWHPKGLDPDDP